MKKSITDSALKIFSSICLSIVCFALVMPPAVFANPTGGEVVAGSASIEQTSATQLTIQQQTQKAIINWQDFSINTNEHTRFIQPSSSSFTLNRVTGGNPSEIMGRLSANGGIMLINQNGILFGPNSQVDVAALVASTHDILDDDFMAGQYDFHLSGHPAASIINQGNISIADMGLAAFVSPFVQNSGVIVAKLGKVELASANGFTLDMYGDDLISILVDDKVAEAAIDKDGNPMDALVDNDGKISADGGYVVLSANAARDIVNDVINCEGIIEARSVEEKNGEIILSGGDSGIVNVSGTLDASGKNDGETGGTIKVLGDKVGLFENAVVDVSGINGGGEVLIGGNYQGMGPEQNASGVYVSEGSEIQADGLSTGDGGRVIVWGDETNRFYGTIFARGGSSSGDGGFVEVSGSYLDYDGLTELSAENGANGTLLLDPNNITIQAAGGSNVNIPNADPFTSTDDTAILLTGSIETALANGNVTISTGTGGTNSQAGNIIINDSITGPANASELKIQAHNNITVNANVNTSAGSSSMLTMTADSDKNGTGTLTVTNGNTITHTNFLMINAADIDLSGQILAATTGIFMSYQALNIGLGNTAGDMSISGTELQNITTSMLNIGGETSQITVDGITTADTATIGSFYLSAADSITGNGQVKFSNNASDFGTSGLIVSANQDILINQNITTTGITEFNADKDVNGSGKFNLAAGQLLNTSSNLTISANKMVIDGNINNTGIGVYLKNSVANQSIDIGSTTDLATNTLEISDAELDRVTAGAIEIGHNTGVVNGDSGSINISSAISSANTTKLTLRTVAGISQSAAISEESLILHAGGTVNMTNSANDVDNLTVSAAGQTVSFKDSDAVSIGSGGVTAQAFNLTTGGGITDSGDLTISSATVFDAGGNIVFDRAGNNYGANLSITAPSASLTGTVNGLTGQAAADEAALIIPVGAGPYTMNGHAITKEIAKPQQNTESSSTSIYDDTELMALVRQVQDQANNYDPVEYDWDDQIEMCYYDAETMIIVEEGYSTWDYIKEHPREMVKDFFSGINEAVKLGHQKFVESTEDKLASIMIDYYEGGFVNGVQGVAKSIWVALSIPVSMPTEFLLGMTDANIELTFKDLGYSDEVIKKVQDINHWVTGAASILTGESAKSVIESATNAKKVLNYGSSEMITKLDVFGTVGWDSIAAAANTQDFFATLYELKEIMELDAMD